MPPRDAHRQPDEDDAGSRRQHAGEVALRRPVDADVVQVLEAVDDRERAEGERQPGAKPGTQRREGEDGRERTHRGDRRCQRVLADPEPRLAVQEGVVEGMEERDDGGCGEHERLAGQGGTAEATGRGKEGGHRQPRSHPPAHRDMEPRSVAGGKNTRPAGAVHRHALPPTYRWPRS
jgi:hypothetical protein